MTTLGRHLVAHAHERRDLVHIGSTVSYSTVRMVALFWMADLTKRSKSIYTVPAGPAAGPGAYDPAVAKAAPSVPSFDKQGAERFTGPESIYRKVR